MKYRDFIQAYFLVDEPKTGKLVPFIFRPIQNRYYDMLEKEYGIEKNGLSVPVREDLLKARRQGFSTFLLALFAADDILSDNPTETLVISYKDDGTKVFRKRYRTLINSYGARKMGHSVAEIQANPGLLEVAAKKMLSVDSDEFELAHNRARFYCGTASARTGGRGGVVQKLLFSEAAFYPDKKELQAKEIIEGTLRQVDLSSGWVFVESTANGDNNHFARMWRDAEAGVSRFKPRFFGWHEYYTPEEFETIKSEFTDKRMIPQEYPATAAEAFISSGNRFFDPALVGMLSTAEGTRQGDWVIHDEYKPGHRYAAGCDVSEGVGRHNSTIVIIDFDASIPINGRLVQKPKVCAVYANNKIAPDTFAHEIRAGGNRYGACLVAPERNNHGFATLSTLKDAYFNIYKDEHDKLGWHTNLASKPKMLHDLRTAIHEGLLEISDPSLKSEITSYPQNDLNTATVDEEDESGGHFDRVIALAIAWQMRAYAVPSTIYDHRDEGFERFAVTGEFNRHAAFNEI
jgi:hypothetical protein